MRKSRITKNLLKILSGTSAVGVGVAGGLVASVATTHVFVNEDKTPGEESVAVLNSLYETVNELNNYKKGDAISDSAKNLINAVKEKIISNPPTYQGTPFSQLSEDAFQDITINNLSFDNMYPLKDLYEASRMYQNLGGVKNFFTIGVAPSQITTKNGEEVNLGGYVNFINTTLTDGTLSFESGDYSSFSIHDDNYSSVYEATSVFNHYTQGDTLSAASSQILDSFSRNLAQYGNITSIMSNNPFSADNLRNLSLNNYSLRDGYTITTDQNKVIQMGGFGIQPSQTTSDGTIKISKEGEKLTISDFGPESFSVSDFQSNNADEAILIDTINQVANGEQYVNGPFGFSFVIAAQSGAYRHLGDIPPAPGSVGGIHFDPITSQNITKTDIGYQIAIDDFNISVPTGSADGSSLSFEGRVTINIDGFGSNMYLSSEVAFTYY